MSECSCNVYILVGEDRIISWISLSRRFGTVLQKCILILGHHGFPTADIRS